MKFPDYSPPAFPSLAQQRDALQKGLGRAWQWALRGRLADEPLLAACLRDQRFDMQVEDSRSDWLWQMIRAVCATEQFRVPVLHALNELSDDRSAQQLCQLARCYAEEGDETFRARLYEIVKQRPFADSPWLGEEEILALDGEQGFLVAARVRGEQLADREWECDDDDLIDLALERWGEESVRSLLETSADAAVRRFQEGWQRDKQRGIERKPPDSDRERMADIKVEEIIRAANGDSKCYWFRGWGRHADEADLQGIIRHIWVEQEPRVVANLLRVFSARRLPKFDPRLIALCQHSNEDVRRWAIKALEPNTHPLVREFALTKLQERVRDNSAVALFINNYCKGDEHNILEAMELPDDANELHWLLMNVLKVLEKNAEADCSRLAVIAYALTPCENCRFTATRILLNQHAAPAWLKEECFFDSGKECRKLVEKDLERQAE